MAGRLGPNADRQVYIRVGDVIDMSDSELCEASKSKKVSVRSMIRAKNHVNRIQVFSQPESQHFIRGKIVEILWLRAYPRNVKGKWYNEVDCEVRVENAYDEEATLKAENTMISSSVFTRDEDKTDKRMPEFRYGSVNNAEEKEV